MKHDAHSRLISPPGSRQHILLQLSGSVFGNGNQTAD